MPRDVKIISARRAYEFEVDVLRLTMLTVAPAAHAIQAAFSFQAATITTPQPTFGTVAVTSPPGLVFQSGAWASSEGQQIIPIRFLHIEPRRIVIDVAGPSSSIDGIFADILAIENQVSAPDGSPVIGEPSGILNYSELTARFDPPIGAWVPDPLRRVAALALGIDAQSEHLTFLPTFTAEAVNPQEEYLGVTQLHTHYLQFALRAGSKPDDPVYFSAASLDSESHFGYLVDLEKAFQEASSVTR